MMKLLDARVFMDVHYALLKKQVARVVGLVLMTP